MNSFSTVQNRGGGGADPPVTTSFSGCKYVLAILEAKPCKHAAMVIICHNGVGIGAMLQASGRHRLSSGKFAACLREKLHKFRFARSWISLIRYHIISVIIR